MTAMTATDIGAGTRREALGAELAVLGVALVWGASYPVAKGALAHAPVITLIFLRFLATALVMAGVAWRDLAAAPRRDRLAGAATGLVLFGIFLAETWGIALGSASNAALIISLCTVMVPFLDFGQQRRLPPAGVILGAGIAVAGVGVLAGGAGALGPGDLLVLVAAGLRAVMVVATRRVIAGTVLSSAALTALQAGAVTLASGMVLLAGGAGLGISGGTGFWAALGFLVLFCTLGAFYVQNAALRRASPTRVALLLGTEPIFGFALAALLLAEPVTALRLGGAALIVGGTFLGLLAERGK
ncbi:DMT family transporter [Paracoccus litorisediminis]|uniref:EamA family transporter n=1 Tax=Paracoccus litorisediminis TaxID=2006130 RepID=A0A844HHF5_9RHOB|nr:DMT family transporter [Paracoccus litorisediminis]MTH59483.1 EamA family transporter [Paracoccus litorisediminis]